MATVGKSTVDFSPAYTEGGNGIATDVGEVVGPSVVITAFQQKAVGELIPDFEIDADRGEGVGQDFLMFRM